MQGAGNIIILNNGDRSGSQGDSSSIVEITPPLDSADHYYIHPDSAFGPRTPTWSYSNGSSFYAQHLGGAYRLPNGNTMATLGTANRLVEVTYSGQVVWQYNVGAQIGRALKYPRDFNTGSAEPRPGAALAGSRLCAGPNPMVRSTRVSYSLPVRSNVTLTLHDVTGRVARNLACGVTSAGAHTVDFAPGSGLPAGIYFLRLHATPADGSISAPHSSTLRLVKGE
jgi:hypothetical protein